MGIDTFRLLSDLLMLSYYWTVPYCYVWEKHIAASHSIHTGILKALDGTWQTP